jgi:hypothetical protein
MRDIDIVTQFRPNRLHEALRNNSANKICDWDCQLLLAAIIPQAARAGELIGAKDDRRGRYNLDIIKCDERRKSD